MVNAWVWPACTTWPGETRRSTTSPLIGASTGICADEGAFARSARILDSQNLHPLLRRIQIRLRLVAVGLSLLQIAFRNGMVLHTVPVRGHKFFAQGGSESAAFK